MSIFLILGLIDYYTQSNFQMRPNTEKIRKLFYAETNIVYKFFLLNLSVPLGIGLVYG